VQINTNDVNAPTPLQTIDLVYAFMLSIFLRSGPGASVSTKVTDDATVHGLRCELERCLLSNKEKRIQVSNLQEDLRKLKKEFGEYRIRCERSEKTAEEYKVE
jgi:hypothetical protein